MVYTLERVSVKFQVMDRAFVIRKQFPICLSYGMTIHKSQGLSLKNALIDGGNSIFSSGQIYVALSRVTMLQGLHLINYDPSSVKANPLAVVEYNRLRSIYKPELQPLVTITRRKMKMYDVRWAVSKKVIQIQATNEQNFCNSLNIKGLQNTDNVSCYAISVIQCFMNCSIIKEAVINNSNDIGDIYQSFIKPFISNVEDVDIINLRHFVGGSFTENIQQDAGQFIGSLCEKLCCIKIIIQHQVGIESMCKSCNNTTVYPANVNNILLLSIPSGSKKNFTMQEIIDDNIINWKDMKLPCNVCKFPLRQRTKVAFTHRIIIIQLLLFDVINGKVEKKKCSIKSVSQAKILINGRSYKVISAIFHHGETVSSGHYTAMLRCKGTTWISVDDLNVAKKNWPRNSKDVYILFLEQIK